MYPIKKENGQYLHSQNIRITDLNNPVTMSEPTSKVVQMPKVRMLRGGRPASAIKITNVKSIKPPDPESQKKQDEENLRAQLQKEIASRSRACGHRGYECTAPVLAGRAHCARHVLGEPGAPYRQCAHVLATGLRCHMLAPDDARDHRDQLCFEHARMALTTRQRNAGPPPPVITPETLLNQLQHYIRPERTRTTSCASSVSVVSDPADEPQQPITNLVDPFKQIDAIAVNANHSTTIMECVSDSDTDNDDVATLGPGGDCRAACDHDPEHEDAPAELGPLWHANIYTAEEVVSEARTTLRTLQAAYRAQLARLRELLRAARRDYLRDLRAERDQYCSISSQAKSSPLTVRERQQLRKLKAYLGYHRKHGVEAILAKKLLRKRARVNEIGPSRPIPSQGRCTFVEGGVRCENPGLPAAKHCMKHILLDKHQVLFSPCGDPRGGVSCREPVARLPLPSPYCRYHSAAPPYVYINPKVAQNKPEETDVASPGPSASCDVEGSPAKVSTILKTFLPKMPYLSCDFPCYIHYFLHSHVFFHLQKELSEAESQSTDESQLEDASTEQSSVVEEKVELEPLRDLTDSLPEPSPFA
ncbi:KAT8 regulatory NSL complex subunit 2 [Epargyreus clarus]|uniref:KAT8 regulatory NSL complex subunit 2 n=1 Tax=Epargyreus clarus TaxID=520877 RepID=UPI003C2FDF5E